MPITLNTPVTGDITWNHSWRFYEFTLIQPSRVNIAVNSAYDNYLELYQGESTTIFMQDDDSGSKLNAMINANLPAGVYYVVVRPYSDGSGPFTLTVTATPGM